MGFILAGIMTHFPKDDDRPYRNDSSAFPKPGVDTASIDPNSPGGSAAPLRQFLRRAARPRLVAGHGPCRGSPLRRFGTSTAHFQRCLAFKARIASINSYAAGTKVGYGLTHTLDRDSRLASVTAGYGDGYRRALASQGSVLVHGRRAAIVDIVSMNSMVVDVTDVAEFPLETKSCSSGGKDAQKSLPQNWKQRIQRSSLTSTLCGRKETASWSQ